MIRKNDASKKQMERRLIAALRNLEEKKLRNALQSVEKKGYYAIFFTGGGLWADNHDWVINRMNEGHGDDFTGVFVGTKVECYR